MKGEIINKKVSNIGTIGGYVQDCNTELRDGTLRYIIQGNMPRWGNCPGFMLGKDFLNEKDLTEFFDRNHNDPTKYSIEGSHIYITKYTNPQPENFSAEKEGSKIKLSWSIKPGIEGLTTSVNYSIQVRKVESNDSWEDVNVVSGNLTYDPSEMTKTLFISQPEKPESNTVYEFRLKRWEEAWNDTVIGYYPTTTC